MAVVPFRGRAFAEPGRTMPEAAAAQALYERHAARISGYCLHQLGSPEEAEDALQTTFLNAFRALQKGIVPESELAWLFKIAENVCLSRRRSSWRRGRIESPADFDLVEAVVPAPQSRRDELIGIEDALGRMPEQQRRAILLREWQGLSYREIAAELDITQSAVETLIFRARRALANGLEEPGTRRVGQRLRLPGRLADVATLAAAAKSFLFGTAAKATATAVAVTATAGAAATVAPRLAPEAPPPTRAHAPLRAAATVVPGVVASRSGPDRAPAGFMASVATDHEPRDARRAVAVQVALGQPKATPKRTAAAERVASKQPSQRVTSGQKPMRGRGAVATRPQRPPRATAAFRNQPGNGTPARAAPTPKAALPAAAAQSRTGSSAPTPPHPGTASLRRLAVRPAPASAEQVTRRAGGPAASRAAVKPTAPLRGSPRKVGPSVEE
ncbi:MAG TPA: sigma-70 family RNA polymerase sigma factor [Gaiellaceae bacterium]|nr:sigma-70 family RNA polymerase sigma factor [Gaiellaceae bacterium]